MNICSNQIKEVILHRFKVNSLQKLLIHINFLLAFIVLFCSHSAFGQGTAVVGNPMLTLVGRDYSGIPNSSYIVDLGLSDVYWADRNVGAKKTTDKGDYFAWGEINTKKSFRVEIYDYWKHSVYTSRQYYFKKYWVNTSYPSKNNANYIDNIKELQPRDDAATQQWGTYWRMPTADNVRNLLNNTNKNSTNNGVTIQNNNSSIFIPSSGYRGAGMVHDTKYTYFWSSTLYSGTDMEHNSYTAYAFVSKGNNATPYIKSDELRFAGIPVRPVIDKFVVRYINIVDGNTTSNDTIHVPNGTKITLTASNYGCYDLEWLGVSNSSQTSSTITIEVTSDITITAKFTKKAFSVTASPTTGGNASISPSPNAAGGKYLCGTPISLTATVTDDCYTFDHWKKDGTKIDGAGATLSVPVSEDATYEAIFSIKTTDIVATTEDDQKGTVGILEPINN